MQSTLISGLHRPCEPGCSCYSTEIIHCLIVPNIMSSLYNRKTRVNRDSALFDGYCRSPMTRPLLCSKPIPARRDYPVVEGPADPFAPPVNRVSLQKRSDGRRGLNPCFDPSFQQPAPGRLLSFGNQGFRPCGMYCSFALRCGPGTGASTWRRRGVVPGSSPRCA